MPIQYADKQKQPGESLRYSMTFSPGRAIAMGDSLAGTPTVTVVTYPDGEDMSASMIEAGSVSRIGNTVYVGIRAGVDGQVYNVTFKCDTANGEIGVEEDLVIEVKEL